MLKPLLLLLLGYLAAFGPVACGWADLPAAIPFALMAAAVAWAWWIWGRRGGRGRAASASALTVLLGLHAYWYFGFSTYGEEGAGIPVPGDPAPEFQAVRVRDGASFHLSAQRGHEVVLVFFRGAW